MANFRFIKIEYKLKKIIQEGYLDKADIYLFGANGHAAFIIRFLQEHKYNVKAIFDNNEEKSGILVEGIKVMTPQNIETGRKRFIFIASAYYKEMKAQLEKIGYLNEEIVELLGNETSMDCDLLDDDILSEELKMIRKGVKTAENLRNEERMKVPIYVAPVGSVGDIYLLCLYFNEYLCEQNIDNYILAIPGKAGCRLAERFGYKNIICINAEEAQALIKARLLFGLEESKIYVLHCGYMHIRIPCYMLMYKKMTWIENYRKVLFGLQQEEKKLYLKTEEIPSIFIEDLVKKKGFKEGRTVIIAPYANTLAHLEDKFWIVLTERLKERGFEVFTNVTQKEKEIKGSKRLNIELEYAVPMLEKAGYFIGLRSGFCDIISSARCKKIIVYTKEVFETVRVIDFYSLNKMGLCDDAIEMEVTYNIEQDVGEVLRNL